MPKFHFCPQGETAAIPCINSVISTHIMQWWLFRLISCLPLKKMADVLVEYDGMQCMSSPSKEVIEARKKRIKDKEERRRQDPSIRISDSDSNAPPVSLT